MIKVISQNTREREEETLELFNMVEPLLNKGYLLKEAVAEVKDINHYSFQQRSWYKEVRDLAISKGYDV